MEIKSKPIMKTHSFGKINPNNKCYGTWSYRTAVCGINVKKEFVTNKIGKVNCKRCLIIRGDS